jgi:hypothetical protein
LATGLPMASAGLALHMRLRAVRKQGRLLLRTDKLVEWFAARRSGFRLGVRLKSRDASFCREWQSYDWP